MAVTISTDSDDPHIVLADAVCVELKDPSDFEGKLENMWDVYDTLIKLPPPSESEPYKYYYKGRELLDAASKAAHELIATSDRVEVEWHLMAIDLAMGRNLYWCEEVQRAEVRFMRDLKLGLLAPRRKEKKYIFAIVDCLQQLGNIWLERGDWTKAMNFLVRAAHIHITAVGVKLGDDAQWDNSDSATLEKLKTLTVYGLARAYGGLGMVASASRACSMTLSRQLEHNVDPLEEEKDAPFNYREWARNAIGLADYYIGRGEFWTAEYLMHAARVISVEWPEKLGEVKSDEFLAEIWRDIGRFYRTRLEISKFHVKLNADECLALWRSNAEVKESDEVNEIDLDLKWECLADDLASRAVEWDSQQGFPQTVSVNDGALLLDERSAVAERVVENGDDDKMLTIRLAEGLVVETAISFPSIHSSIEKAMQVHNKAFLEAHEGVIDHDKHLTFCAKDYATARELFKIGQYFDQQALTVFVLEGYASDHVQTVQELARLHEALEFWEADQGRVKALLKRRVRLLEPILKEINPMVYVQFDRQLSFEIADIYRRLAEDLLEKDEENRAVAAASKPALDTDQVRRYILKSVKNFTHFIESFYPPATREGTVSGSHPDNLLERVLF
ncbi:hypothetical protein Pmar_PMAR018239 [Perkinsus marinus ATCC 50983]|uniref:KIF-binding protein n=1 Tax=Perkinsus marinus (strain ATCC 50983 / TXsc) TaxID=423536 RepID=C5KZ87_PERM5|nr:hypothetical protein Pmar_PMAR018239 [Perkinsus marinus ATCC 50983]EER10237.1 hypothetical protein Pmar_PMAR018239 [Perkinsus marinus ATCC 50983]|eukprot:XP_002778442.1 hypothetical protein Pmar_PMAR018239 [Perkinsus marinus ATCC 50983]